MMYINKYAVTSSRWVANEDKELFLAILRDYAGVMLPTSEFSTGTDGKSYITVGFMDVMDFNEFEITIYDVLEKPLETKPTWLQRILRSFL